MLEPILIVLTIAIYPKVAVLASMVLGGVKRLWTCQSVVYARDPRQDHKKQPCAQTPNEIDQSARHEIGAQKKHRNHAHNKAEQACKKTNNWRHDLPIRFHALSLLPKARIKLSLADGNNVKKMYKYLADLII